MDKYLRDLSRGHGTWARAAGVDEHTINRQGEICDAYYQEYLPTEAIEIGGVLDALAELSHHVRMTMVTTAKRVDFQPSTEIVVTPYMDFVLVREDYRLAKPDPEPYLSGLKRFGAAREECWWSRTQPRAELARRCGA